MRIARFYQKTLFGVFAMIGLIVALTSALYVNTVDRQLTGDFLNNSRAIARSIADSNVDLIVHRNYSALQSIIDQFVEISGISYVFVVDEKGVIIAHTFVPGVPDEIVADYKDAKNVYDRTLTGLGNFSVVAACIIADEAGYVHVGIDKGYIALQVQTAIGKEVRLIGTLPRPLPFSSIAVDRNIAPDKVIFAPLAVPIWMKRIGASVPALLSAISRLSA